MAKSPAFTHANANDQLKYVLNELRALDCGEDIPADRFTVPERLRWLAEYIESGADVAPDAVSIVHDAANLPIQH